MRLALLSQTRVNCKELNGVRENLSKAFYLEFPRQKLGRVLPYICRKIAVVSSVDSDDGIGSRGQSSPRDESLETFKLNLDRASRIPRKKQDGISSLFRFTYY